MGDKLIVKEETARLYQSHDCVCVKIPWCPSPSTDQKSHLRRGWGE